MAQAVVDAGAVPHLVLCLQEPELSLKRVTASTLAEIAKHTPEVLSAHLNHSQLSSKLSSCSWLKSLWTLERCPSWHR